MAVPSQWRGQGGGKKMEGDTWKQMYMAAPPLARGSTVVAAALTVAASALGAE